MELHPWDGTPVAPGPIALSFQSSKSEKDRSARLICGTESGVVVIVSRSLVDSFLECHQDRLFLSTDVPTIHRQLLDAFGKRRSKGRDMLWAISREGRWVDLRLFDRQIRYVLDRGDFRLREWQANEAVAKQNLTAGEGACLPADNFSRMFSVYRQLAAKASQLAANAGPPPLPEYVLDPLPPDQMNASRARSSKMIQSALDRRLNSGSAEAPISPADQHVEPPTDELSDEDGREIAPLGHQVDIWATVSLVPKYQIGLTVDSARLPPLLLLAKKEYERASLILSHSDEARGCFEWKDGVVDRSLAGHPKTRQNHLRRWLQKAIGDLCDFQFQDPDVPRDKEGRPFPNPEYWGFWPACNNVLCAWRQLFRMAEVARIAGPSHVIPTYETVPSFRSYEPNLAVYRSLGVPVFRPKDGHVFLVGKQHNLRARSLAMVCIRRGYVPELQARLYQFVLRKDDPLEWAANELFKLEALNLAQERRDTNVDYANSNDDGMEHETEPGLLGVLKSEPENFERWKRLTHALLETIPFGLPTSFLAVLLRNDYALDDLQEPRIRHLQYILANRIASELGSFLLDPTPDYVASRIGLTANEQIRKMFNADYLSSAGPTTVNDLKKRRFRKPLLQQLQATSFPKGMENSRPARKELYQYRGISLANRVTPFSASAAVRKQEVLMTCEEVMLAIAHDLRAAGYRLLGITPDEFVLELPKDELAKERGNVARIVEEASWRILGDLTSHFSLTEAKFW